MTVLPVLIPVDLRCRGLAHPCGIDAPAPALRWRLAGAPAAPVAAYRIVAASGDDPGSDNAAPWREGSGDDAVLPIPLAPWTGYAWRVQVRTADGQVSAWSEPGRLTTGPLSDADWPGPWIAAAATGVMTAPPRPRQGFLTERNNDRSAAAWLQIDLGERRAPDAVELDPLMLDGKAGGWARRLVVAIGDAPDGSDHAELAAWRGQDAPPAQAGTLRIAGTGAAGRYLRITALERVPWGRMQWAFGLGRVRVLRGGTDLAAGCPVSTPNSSEGFVLRAEAATGVTEPPVPARMRLDGDDGPGLAAIRLRGRIESSPARRVLIAVCGLGMHELWINGARQGDALLACANSRYDRRVRYRVLDVTAAWRAGANLVGVVLGNGWWRMPVGDLFSSERAPWTAPVQVRLAIAIDGSDGRRTVLGADRSWRWSVGETTFTCIRGGEDADLRRRDRWLDGDGGPGEPVLVVPAPAGRLCAELAHPVRRLGEHALAALPGPAPGSAVYRPRRGMQGWVRAELDCPAGSTLELRFPGADSHTGGRYQLDRITAAGVPGETWEPSFTYHGFDRVEVSGADPARLRLTAIEVGSDLPAVGAFRCADRRLDRLHEAVAYTIRNYCLHRPADPVREKLGWIQDVQTGFDAVSYLVDSETMYRQWDAEMGDEQSADGFVPPVCPTAWWTRNGSWNDPWWMGMALELPWKLYRWYGDRAALAAAWPRQRALLGWLAARREDLAGWGIGDWLEPGTAGPFPLRTPVGVTGLLALVHHASTAARSARALGLDDEARRAEAVADDARTRFATRWLRGDGRIADDSQTAHALALAVGAVDQARRADVAARLIEDIARRDGRIGTGFVGTAAILDVLPALGRGDLAHAMVTASGRPGWIDTVDRFGHLMESWEGHGVLQASLQTPIAAYLYRHLAGIGQADDDIGWRHARLAPVAPAGLDWVEASFAAPTGTWRSAWHRQGGRWCWQITVPPGCVADVVPPGQDGCLDGVALTTAAVRVGAGEHRVELSATA